MKKSAVHFLHIRKTGGTAIKEALKEVSETQKYHIVLHRHKTRLRDIPEGEKVFFFLRDPVSRFVSGFNSRLRQGHPRYNSPWNDQERIAFSRFKTANALAEALPCEIEAKLAMERIRHINSFYADWFGSIRYFQNRRGDILLIGFQETLSQDFNMAKILLGLPGLPESIVLPKDSVLAHKTPDEYHVFLSERAKQNLKIWYAKDYEFIAFCRKLEVSSTTMKL